MKNERLNKHCGVTERRKDKSRKEKKIHRILHFFQPQIKISERNKHQRGVTEGRKDKRGKCDFSRFELSIQLFKKRTYTVFPLFSTSN